MTAGALHPGPDEQVSPELFRREVEAGREVDGPLSTTDREELERYWRRADLPPIEEGWTVRSWHQYLDAVNNAPDRPPWQLAAHCPRTPLREQVAHDHLKALREAIESGRVLTRDSRSMVPAPRGSNLAHVVLDRGELEKFCGSLCIEVVIQETPKQRTARLKVDHEWRKLAQDEARRIIKRQAALDLFPSQDAIANEIAAAFRSRSQPIHGSDGKPLSGATIKRHALKGISSATFKARAMNIERGE